LLSLWRSWINSYDVGGGEMSALINEDLPFADGISIAEIVENHDGSLRIAIDIPKDTSHDILSGFFLRAIVDAAKELNPDRPKSVKDKLIERLEAHLQNAALYGAPAKAYASALAEVISDVGGPDYMEAIEIRFGDVG
jgi:hypothetical protein